MSLPPSTQIFDLSNKTAIVTGASGGIGQVIAKSLAAAGANIIVHTHQNETGAQSLVTDIHAMGRQAIVVQADLQSDTDCEKLISKTLESLGTPHILINNAGAQPISNLVNMDASELQTVMSTNIAAPILLTTLFANTPPCDSGTDTTRCITNIASIEGLNAKSGHSHYASSKAALIAFTKAAALELGRAGIRVNSICPGLINRDGLEAAWPEGVAAYTNAAPLGTLGSAEDIANAVLFLNSTAARWITGANLVVDGGVSCAETW